ncbi:siderophore-iron reductase FhuF [uncultured Thalassospira sp.]|uniref:siderophore-iron reductase FhuF n=1 Tax=uncultured Thalassospira sp. TaxID=404382 RepID=UPI002584C166|nr:siderophore-iron reductase FhuF [uncultured Thalassospira sp.]
MMNSLPLQNGSENNTSSSIGDALVTRALSNIKTDLFQGPYQGLGDRHYILAAQSNGIDCFALHDPECLAPILDHYCRAKYPDDDRRAAISMWSQWYFGIFLSPLLVMAAAGEVVLPFQPGFISLKTDDNQCPTGFDIRDWQLSDMKDQSAAPDPWTHIESLIAGHLEPMVASLAASSKVSPKVFWSNISVVVSYVEKHVLKNTRISLAPLISDAKRPDGNRNPMANPYSTKQSEDGSPSRRVCCLRYLLTSVDICPTCPLAKL